MAERLVNLGSQNSKGIFECNPKGYPEPYREEPTKACGKVGESLLEELLDDNSNKKTGYGKSQLCDPMQTGQIVADPDNPQNNTVYRYAKGIRGCDEATMDLFRNMVVLDEDGKAHPVPIIWASQEKAVAAILQDNVRKDDSLVVDRIKLPMLAIYSHTFQFNQARYTYHKAVDYLNYLRPDNKPGATIKSKYERDTIFGFARGIPVDIGYTLYAWTLYVEDMNQLLEQLLTKFSPIAYIKVRGVPWETTVKLDSIANNLNIEPGDGNVRVVKFEFNLTAETYIPQPVVRQKAVLKMKTDIFNAVKPEEITEVMCRLEESVKELR